MEKKKDSPGVYIPPPLFYVATFLAAVFLQKKITIKNTVFHSAGAKGFGVLLLAVSLIFMITSILKFFRTKNTLILIKPASSLQTTGIYAMSRNPMYTSLALLYLGLTCIIGSWWNIILFPVLILVVQKYIIRREEKYLERAFGEKYLEYKQKVRRWI